MLAAPETRIVSLTITEGGYTPNPDDPKNVFRYLADALRERRDLGLAPFTVLSCDNLPGNGDAAKRAHISHSTGHGPGPLDRAERRVFRTQWWTGLRRRPLTPTGS